MRLPIACRSFIGRHRFILLFGTLVVFYVLVPILHQLRSFFHAAVPSVVEGIVFVTLLTGAVVSASRKRLTMWIALALGLPAAALWVVDLFIVSDALGVIRQLLAAVFLIFVIGVIFHHIFVPQRVTFNTVCASLCIYLLMGLVWALGYSVVDQLDSSAFTCTVASKEPPLLHLSNTSDTAVLYFSFATLTTLGYGDIVPTSPITRMLASVEAIAGQLYLTVLVARLVGLHIAESMDQRARQETDGLPHGDDARDDSD